MKIDNSMQQVRLAQMEVASALDKLQTECDLTDMEMSQAVVLWMSTVLGYRVRSDLLDRTTVEDH